MRRGEVVDASGSPLSVPERPNAEGVRDAYSSSRSSADSQLDAPAISSGGSADSQLTANAIDSSNCGGLLPGDAGFTARSIQRSLPRLEISDSHQEKTIEMAPLRFDAMCLPGGSSTAADLPSLELFDGSAGARALVSDESGGGSEGFSTSGIDGSEAAGEGSIGNFAPEEKGGGIETFSEDGSESGPPAEDQDGESGDSTPGADAQDGEENIDATPPPPAPQPVPVPTTERRQIRERLESAGINPSDTGGISITVIDRSFDRADGHGAVVAGVIDDPEFGLAPGAPVERVGLNPDDDLDLDKYVNEKDGLDRLMSDMSHDVVDKVTAQLQDVLEKREPSMRVINMSFGTGLSVLGSNLLHTMALAPEKCRPWLVQLLGKERAQRWIDGLSVNGGQVESANPDLDRELYGLVVRRMDSVLSNDPRMQQSMDRYRETTRQAAEDGVFIVVSAGNSEHDLDFLGDGALPSGNGFNWYARSPYVISVGASNINDTPGDRSDDQVADFSSSGTEKYHPTLVAHGQHLETDNDADPDNAGVSGTSIAAPQVATAVALMLAQNPALSFRDVNRLLQASCQRLDGASSSAQGAGALKLEEAVIAARRSRGT